jgi:hypothetical protein
MGISVLLFLFKELHMTAINVLEVSFEESSEQTLEDTMHDLILLSDSMTTPAGKKTIEAAIEAIAEEQRRRAAKPVLVAM